MRLHHQLVAIHAFPNGNGRHSRAAADLMVEAMGMPRFTWGRTSLIDPGDTRGAYIDALRAADGHDLEPLVSFVRS